MLIITLMLIQIIIKSLLPLQICLKLQILTSLPILLHPHTSSSPHPHHTRPQFLLAGKRRFSIRIWKTFTDCFNCLPIAAIVDEKIFCCHGGLSPDLHSMEQIRRIMRPTDVPDTGKLPSYQMYNNNC